jgi:hypothetical protein
MLHMCVYMHSRFVENHPIWILEDGLLFLRWFCHKHKTRDYDRLQGFTDEVLKTAKGGDQEKKPKEPKGDFPEAQKEVNYIYGGPDSYESRRKQKRTDRELMAVSPATPEYLKWSVVTITFDRSDHPDFVPKPMQYPLIFSFIVKDIKLN